MEPLREYLYKKSPAGIRGYRRWQKRFFELGSRCILYFTSDKKSQPLGVVNLLETIDVKWYPEKKKGTRFDIRVVADPSYDNSMDFDEELQIYVRVYALRAPNKDVAIEWVTSIREALQRVRAQVRRSDSTTGEGERTVTSDSEEFDGEDYEYSATISNSVSNASNLSHSSRTRSPTRKSHDLSTISEGKNGSTFELPDYLSPVLTSKKKKPLPAWKKSPVSDQEGKGTAPARRVSSILTSSKKGAGLLATLPLYEKAGPAMGGDSHGHSHTRNDSFTMSPSTEKKRSHARVRSEAQANVATFRTRLVTELHESVFHFARQRKRRSSQQRTITESVSGYSLTNSVSSTSSVTEITQEESKGFGDDEDDNRELFAFQPMPISEVLHVLPSDVVMLKNILSNMSYVFPTMADDEETHSLLSIASNIHLNNAPLPPKVMKGSPMHVLLRTMKHPDAVQVCLSKVYPERKKKRKGHQGHTNGYNKTNTVRGRPSHIAASEESVCSETEDSESDIDWDDVNNLKVSREYDSSAHGLGLRLIFMLLCREQIQSQLARSGHITRSESIALACEEFCNFCRNHVHGRALTTHAQNALTHILVTPMEKLHTSLEEVFMPPSFNTPVQNAGVWRALFESLKHSPFVVRMDALEDVSTLLINHHVNCESLRSLGDWQTLVYPLLTDMPTRSARSTFLQKVYALTLNVFALMHYDAFFRRTDFQAELVRSLDRLQSFGGFTDKTQDVARTMLFSLTNKLARSTFSFPLHDLEEVSWKNLILLIDLVRKFVLHTPFWRESSRDSSKKPITLPSTPPSLSPSTSKHGGPGDNGSSNFLQAVGAGTSSSHAPPRKAIDNGLADTLSIISGRRSPTGPLTPQPRSRSTRRPALLPFHTAKTGAPSNASKKRLPSTPLGISRSLSVSPVEARARNGSSPNHTPTSPEEIASPDVPSQVPMVAVPRMGSVEEKYRDITLEMMGCGDEIDWKDRSYMLQRFRKTFTGKSAVSWIVKYKHAKNERDAIILGNQLVVLKYIHHVCRNRPFQNSEEPFQFNLLALTGLGETSFYGDEPLSARPAEMEMDSMFEAESVHRTAQRAGSLISTARAPRTEEKDRELGRLPELPPVTSDTYPRPPLKKRTDSVSSTESNDTVTSVGSGTSDTSSTRGSNRFSSLTIIAPTRSKDVVGANGAKNIVSGGAAATDGMNHTLNNNVMSLSPNALSPGTPLTPMSSGGSGSEPVTPFTSYSPRSTSECEGSDVEAGVSSPSMQQQWLKWKRHGSMLQKKNGGRLGSGSPGSPIHLLNSLSPGGGKHSFAKMSPAERIDMINREIGPSATVELSRSTLTKHSIETLRQLNPDRDGNTEYGLHWKSRRQRASEVNTTGSKPPGTVRECADSGLVRSVLQLMKSLRLDTFSPEQMPNVSAHDKQYYKQCARIFSFWKGLEELISILETAPLSKRRIEVVLMKFVNCKNSKERGHVFDYVRRLGKQSDLTHIHDEERKEAGQDHNKSPISVNVEFSDAPSPRATVRSAVSRRGFNGSPSMELSSTPADTAPQSTDSPAAAAEAEANLTTGLDFNPRRASS